MIAAACTGEITSESSGTEKPPAAPMPPFETPVRMTAGTATA
jgi:hypothetical protein